MTTDTEVTQDEVFAFLIELRDSGATNMWGAGPYISREFGMPEKEAGEWLIKWINSFEEKK